jgi:hypothetical protein
MQTFCPKRCYPAQRKSLQTSAATAMALGLFMNSHYDPDVDIPDRQTGQECRPQNKNSCQIITSHISPVSRGTSPPSKSIHGW